jgi:O-antigen/teichoic acid export membrane protein
MMIAVSLAISGALIFATSIIVARSVGVTEFGFYAITVSLQNIAILFSSFGLGVAITKFVAEYIVRDFRLALKFARAGFQLVLLFASVTAVVYFALSDLIGNGLYGEPEVADLIPFSVLVAFSCAMHVFMSGLAQGNQRLKLLSVIQVTSPVISLSLIVLLLPSLGIKAPFIGLFIAYITVAALTALRLARTGFPLFGRVKAESEVPYHRMLLAFAVPSVMAGLMITPVFWVGNTILTLESGFLAMGYFGVAMVFFQGLNMMAASVSIPLVPRVSEMTVHMRDQIGPLVSKSIRAASFVLFPLFFAVALFSREVIGLLYGPDYRESSDAAYLMVAASYYYVLATPVGSAIAGLGRMWVSLGLNIIWAAVFVVLALLLSPVYGPAGLGMAFALSYGIHVGTSAAAANTVLRLKVRGILVGIVPSIALFALAYYALSEYLGGQLLLKGLVLALGSALMLYLGRSEVRLVSERVLRR